MRRQIQEAGVLRTAAGAAAALLAALPAHASFLSGDALDTAANWLAWFVIIVMPLVAIGAFLYVHVLPEVIAERRHHPHKDSIKVLCILSLFFGGMLWPFAWLWAYTKPIGYRAIYGTEKHEDYYHELGEKLRAGSLTAEERAQLRHELESMAAKGALTPTLQRILDELKKPPDALPGVAALREKAAEAH
jgi:CBS domain containing-hemolysin-like protein